MMSITYEIPSPESTDEEILLAACQQYFLEGELVEAHRMVESGLAYEEAIAYLAKSAEDDLRTSGKLPYWFFTIPSGNVLIYRPDYGFPERPIYTVHASYLACRTFPSAEQTVAEETPVQKRQLSFWDASQIEGGDAVGQRTPQDTHREKRAKPKKLTYVEQPIAVMYGPTGQGWVVKDRGLGYVVASMSVGEGYLITLIHLKSRRELASVIIQAVNHERIREWVSACALLTDWNQGIKAILAEKQGKQKQSAWSRQLEAIWWQQKGVKRQLAFF